MVVGAELLEAGQLSLALERAGKRVKEEPADTVARTFYFELLCLTGELARAATHLEVLASASEESRLAVATYQVAIQAEIERRSFFRGGDPPRSLLETASVALQRQAVQLYAAGDFTRVAAVLGEAEEARPRIQGTLNGKEFSELRDSNDLTGPILEVIVEGHYAWVPWEAVKSFSLQEPKHLRDLVWSHAAMSLHTGFSGHILLPSLYVTSHQHTNDDVRLGRRTEWNADIQEFTVAAGQKVITADDEIDCGILEIRALEVVTCPAQE